MGSENLIDVRIVGELLEDQAHGNPRPPDHRLSPQDRWIRADAVFVPLLRVEASFTTTLLPHTGRGGIRVSDARDYSQEVR